MAGKAEKAGMAGKTEEAEKEEKAEKAGMADNKRAEKAENQKTEREKAVKEEGKSLAVNRGERYQIILFPFNNAATNCYLTLMNYIVYYACGFVPAVFSVVLTVTISGIITGMRIFDGITDPVIGWMIDKTGGRWGKFRPFMIAGNVILALSAILQFFLLRTFTGAEREGLRWVCFIAFYVLYVIGYTCQCACTKSGQTCITNDPEQRPQFVIWNMAGMIGSIVLVTFLATLLNMYIDGLYKGDAGYQGAFYTAEFYDILVPIVVVLSAVYTLLAVIAIWKKDRPEFWGVEQEQKGAKLGDYVDLIKNNSQIRWLILAAASSRLAFNVANGAGIACMIYGSMMGAYNELYIPMYVISFFFMAPFIFWGAGTAGKKGQKRALVQYTVTAFVFYIGLLVLLSVWEYGNPFTLLTIFTTDSTSPLGIRITINWYTVLWIVFYGCGYGAYNCCSEMSIPMVADCTDYETYRSGNYMPGVVGTIFSMIDKVITSLATLLISLFTVVMIDGLDVVPGSQTPYYEGMKTSAILSFCVLPMTAWAVTLLSMRFYGLSGRRLREVQAVNAVRKAAMKGGMSRDEAMQTWKTIDQVPAEYVHQGDKDGAREGKRNILDSWYERIFEGAERSTALPSAHAVRIPEKYCGAAETNEQENR